MAWCDVQHKPGDGECVGCYLDIADEMRVRREQVGTHAEEYHDD